jgi:RNA polymerase sigma-70 factor (ECF subfamily)
MTAEDERVMADLQGGGSEAAARALYRAYADELFGFAVRRLRDRGLAEELVQDVFTRAWRHAGDYDPARGSVRTWLYGIARHAIIDVERHRARRPPVALRDADDRDEAIAREPIEQAVLRWQIELALNRLTVEHREVVRLAHFRGMSVREIAVRLGLAEGTVKSRTYYAMSNLRSALDELGVTA